MVWGTFLFLGGVLVLASIQLARYGDVLAEQTGLGRVWIGALLLATATSLPELVTSIGAVTITGVPDLAVGGVLGSCAFNLAVLALLDVLHRRPLFVQVSPSHTLASGLGVLLTALVTLGLVLSHTAPLSGVLALGWVGLYSPLVIGLYVVSLRLIYQFERRQVIQVIDAEAHAVTRHRPVSRRRAQVICVGAVAVVLLVGSRLPGAAEALAAQTGLAQGFVGTLFVAPITSVPELVVALTALRLGSVDLALSSLLLSNLFNLAVLGLADLCYTKGPILAAVSPDHAITGLTAIMMTGVAIIGLVYPAPSRRFHGISVGTVSLVLLYAGGTYAFFLASQVSP